jgi:hypothetical protein
LGGQGGSVYKAAVLLYIICFTSYLLFSRVPDYFEGEFITGTVVNASFNNKEHVPQLAIDYSAAGKVYTYQTSDWMLKKYKPGEKVTIIYNPSQPKIANIYSFIGYWINWGELLFTAGFFILLFFAAKSITGTNEHEPLGEDVYEKKRKYKD